MKIINYSKSNTVEAGKVFGKQARSWKAMLVNLLSDWSGQTTCHGMRYIFHSNSNILRRLFWATVLGTVIYFLQYGYQFQIHRFREYRTLTKESIRYEESLAFPAVTICSFCLITNDSFEDVKDREFLKYFYGNYSDNVTAIIEEYGEEYIRNFRVSELFNKGSVHAESMFHKCLWMGREFNCTEYLTARRFREGLCYTFNGETNDSFVTSTVGSHAGVSFILYADQENYFMGDLTSAGFKILVHDPTAEPDMTLSTSVSPGFSYYMGITKQEQILLPAPVKAFGERECMKNVSVEFPFTGFHHYSTRACELECLMTYVYEQCGCINPIRPETLQQGEIKECDPIQSLRCAYPAYDTFHKKLKAFVVDKCKCAMPCESTTYDTKLSFAYFPNDNYLKQHTGMTPGHADTIEHVRANYLAVQIFFRTKIVQISEQILEFPLEDLLTSIGGYLGLAVGASVFTLLEFGELLLILLFRPWMNR